MSLSTATRRVRAVGKASRVQTIVRHACITARARLTSQCYDPCWSWPSLSVASAAGLEAFDPDGSEADAIERALGVPVLRHADKKPAGGCAEIKERFSCAAHEVLMVGDRYVTDVMFGTRHGMLTARVAPFDTSGESVAVRGARTLEEAAVARRRRRGLQPVAHPLLESLGPWTREGARH
jgi:Mitochondrial PGP phosphatase